MNSIDFETLLIIIFVLVDDWYQVEGKTWKEKLPGVKPTMSDSAGSRRVKKIGGDNSFVSLAKLLMERYRVTQRGSHTL